MKRMLALACSLVFMSGCSAFAYPAGVQVKDYPLAVSVSEMRLLPSTPPHGGPSACGFTVRTETDVVVFRMVDSRMGMVNSSPSFNMLPYCSLLRDGDRINIIKREMFIQGKLDNTRYIWDEGGGVSTFVDGYVVK